MIHAYGEMYVDDAMSLLGEAFDYAANVCHSSLDDFMNLFVTSGYAHQFESGVSKIISGLSGIELALSIYEKVGINITNEQPLIDYGYSPEYWCGHILAYYQWYSSLPFSEIAKYISMKELLNMYDTLHEASEHKAIDVINAMFQRKVSVTKLALLRKNRAISQKELAKRAGISLRSIQQYEQKRKDINKASFNNIRSIASILGCKIKDLIEPVVVKFEK